MATPEEALAGADIMVEATRLTEPEVLLETRWVTPGTTVIPYGTVSAVEDDLVDVMDKVVVDDWGQAGAGPLGALRRHVDSGRLGRHNLHAELGEIVAGRAGGGSRRLAGVVGSGLGLGRGTAPGELDGVVPAVGARVVLGQRLATLPADAAEREALLAALAGAGVGSGALHRASLGAHVFPDPLPGAARPPWRRPESLPPRHGRRKGGQPERPGQR